MFDIDDENTIDFFTQFEEIIKNLIFEKDLWFHNEMDIDTKNIIGSQCLDNIKEINI